MYCSLRFWNVSCDRVVDIYASKDLVEKASATFLELCGWDVTENADIKHNSERMIGIL